MAQPAHEYRAEPAPAAPAPVAPAPSRVNAWASLAARIVLTLVGAAGLVFGGLLDWIRGISGVDLTGRAFIETTFRHGRNFAITAGFAVIVLGLVAILGLAFRSGWLTRLAGALAIVGFVLFLVQVYRASLSVTDIQAGAWVALAGGVVALIGGFLGTRRTVLAPAAPAAPSTTVIEEP